VPSQIPRVAVRYFGLPRPVVTWLQDKIVDVRTLF
jgi:hypothetical protein